MFVVNRFRGIPSGYLSFVEQRLVETEIVVLELLNAIYSTRIPINPQPLPDNARRTLLEESQKQAKTAKIDEWKRLPITTGAQQRAWWIKKNECIRDTDGIDDVQELQPHVENAQSPMNVELQTQAAQSPLLASWPTTSESFIQLENPPISGSAELLTFQQEFEAQQSDHFPTPQSTSTASPSAHPSTSQEKWRKYF